MAELIMVNISGRNYAIPRKGILKSYERVRVHSLPMGKAPFAGMSKLEGGTVTLVDTSFCIGHGGRKAEAESAALLLVHDDHPLGLAVYEIVSASVEAEIVPLPAGMDAPLYSGVAVFGGAAALVLEPDFLIGTALKAMFRMPQASCKSSYAADDPPSGLRVRVLEAGRGVFAVPAEGTAFLHPGEFVYMPMPVALPPLVGIALQSGRALAVADGGRILGGEPLDESCFCLAASRGSAVSYTCEQEVPDTVQSLHALPPGVPYGPSRAAVVSGERITPYIDPAEVMAARPVPHSALSSRFSAMFGRRALNVVEISVAGRIWGLPGSQVADVVHYRPWQPLPSDNPLIAGVALYDDEPLAVLDLARTRGGASRPAYGWNYALIENGSFRVLVLAEAVYEKRLVTSDRQVCMAEARTQGYAFGRYIAEGQERWVLDLSGLAGQFDAFRARQVFADDLGPAQDDEDDGVPPDTDDVELDVMLQETKRMFSLARIEAESAGDGASDGAGLDDDMDDIDDMEFEFFESPEWRNAPNSVMLECVPVLAHEEVVRERDAFAQRMSAAAHEPPCGAEHAYVRVDGEMETDSDTEGKRADAGAGEDKQSASTLPADASTGLHAGPPPEFLRQRGPLSSWPYAGAAAGTVLLFVVLLILYFWL